MQSTVVVLSSTSKISWCLTGRLVKFILRTPLNSNIFQPKIHWNYLFRKKFGLEKSCPVLVKSAVAVHPATRVQTWPPSLSGAFPETRPNRIGHFLIPHRNDLLWIHRRSSALIGNWTKECSQKVPLEVLVEVRFKVPAKKRLKEVESGGRHPAGYAATVINWS